MEHLADMCLLQTDGANLWQGSAGMPRCPATPRRASMLLDSPKGQSPDPPKIEGWSNTSLSDQFQTPGAAVITAAQVDGFGFRMQQSQLGSALREGSLEKVGTILCNDQEAACIPQAGLEGGLALSEAIVRECDITIIDYLIAHGADPSMLDTRGRTSLIVLATRPRRLHTCEVSRMDIDMSTWFLPFNGFEALQSSLDQKKIDWLLNVAVRLMQAGCNPMECDIKGNSPEYLAREHGWEVLAALIQSWQDFKTCLVFNRSMQKAKAATTSNLTGLAQLHCSLFRCIFTFVCGDRFF